MQQILILGGGAAGLAAALAAAQTAEGRAHITVLDKNAKVGKKLLATGNGRCNLDNRDITPERYFTSSPKALRRLLSAVDEAAPLAWFESLGLYPRTDEAGRVYPYSNQAADVLALLEHHLEKYNVRIRCGCTVRTLSQSRGGYAVQFVNADGQPELATSHMFHFSDRFLQEYMPYTVELGRSFVSLDYQNVRKNSKSIFALDNLWDGLGALTVINPDVRYFFGKMTMYPSYIRIGRDMILYFLKKHFDDKDNLIIPLKPLKIETPEEELRQLFCEDDFKKDYLILNREIRHLGFNIPPLVNAYMNLSATMKLFGTAINDGFGEVEETGILIAVDEILDEKRVRHIDSFVKEHPEALHITSGANKLIYKDRA